MELYKQIIEIVDINVIFCLFPCILTLMLIGFFFKNRDKTKKALNIIRWFIIIYSIITLTHYIFGMIFLSGEYAFLNRATGPYWWAYWFMLICAIVLPFTLLIKKLASKYLYVLFIAIFIKSGFYFERFVIIVTTIHRDYFPKDGTSDWMSYLFYALIAVFLQGFVLAILLLGIVEIIEKSKTLIQKA